MGRAHGAQPVRPYDPAKARVALDEPALGVHLDGVIFEVVRRLVDGITSSLLTPSLVSAHTRDGPAWATRCTQDERKVANSGGVLIVV